jgi:hypothetical protein
MLDAVQSPNPNVAPARLRAPSFEPPGFRSTRACTPSTRGCGAVICAPISFLQLSTEQSYPGEPLAVAEGRVFMASHDNIDGRSKVYVMPLPKTST